MRSIQRTILCLLQWSVLSLAIAGCHGGGERHHSSPAKEWLSQDEAWYRGVEARRIAQNVLAHQSPEGGWPRNTDTASPPVEGRDWKERRGSFDNQATTDEMRFLARMYNATGEKRYRKAFDRGLDFIFEAQYPSGGWPQSYPAGKGYERYITFNDRAMARVMWLLREIDEDKRYAFLDAPRRDAAREAFDRGIDCILKCQIKVSGRLTAWCAQHDEKDFSPQPARSFELVSLSGGSESVESIRLLMTVKNPSPEIITAVDSAVGWLEDVQMRGIRVEKRRLSEKNDESDVVVVKDATAPPMWARFYEIGTNRPFFADRDGIKRWNLADIGPERRNGYAWLGYWPADLLQDEYPQWKAAVERQRVEIKRQ